MYFKIAAYSTSKYYNLGKKRLALMWLFLYLWWMSEFKLIKIITDKKTLIRYIEKKSKEVLILII